MTDHTDHTEHDLRALLADHGWLRRLALRLVRDPGAADDLAQETLVRAIHRGVGAEADGARRRGWLATALRRLALERHRAETRRRRRERAWAPFEEGDADALRRAQLRRDLADEVLRLPEPERTAVTLRYFEDRSYAEIAERMAILEPAARKRVSRGIAKLRERLDQSHGGRDVWTALALPWISDGLDAAAVAAPPTVTAGAVALAMKTQTKLIAAAVVLLGTGWLAWSQFDRVKGSAEGAPRVERAVADSGPSAELANLADRASTNRLAVEPPSAPAQRALSLPAFPERPASTTGTLELQLRWPDGRPGAGVSAELIAWDDPFSVLRAVHHVADEAGLIVAEGLTAGQVSAYLDRANGASFTVRAGATTRGTIELARGFTVTGTVSDPAGAPVAGAELVLSDYGNDGEAKVVAWSDARGRYALPGVEDGRSISARAEGFAPSAARSVGDHPEGAEHVLDLALTTGGARISGVVTDANGTPLHGAFVRIEPEGRDAVDERVTLHPIEVWTDEQGRFDIAGCGAGAIALAVRTEVHAPLRRTVELEEGAHEHLELVMDFGGTLAGRVTRADGTAAEGATVWVKDRVHGPVPRGFRVRAGADGTFELPGLPAGQHEIGAHEKDHGKSTATIDIEGRETEHIELRLVVGRDLEGTVVDERGEPLAGWKVMTLVGPMLFDRDSDSAADGTFTLADVRENATELHVAAPGQWMKGTVATVPITEGPIVIQIPDAVRPSASVELRVLADGRAPDPAAKVEWVSEEGFGRADAFTDAEGEVELAGLRPGASLISIHLDGYATARRRVTLKSDSVEDLGIVELVRGGRVAVEIEPGAGVSPAQVPGHAALWDEGGNIATSVNLVEGSGLTEPLAPGRYSVSAGADVVLSGAAVVDVVDGETTAFRAACEPGAALLVQVDSPITGLLQRGFVLEIRGSDGGVLRRHRQVHPDGQPDRVYVSGLPRGQCTIRILANGQRSGEVTVDVSPGSGVTEARIELR